MTDLEVFLISAAPAGINQSIPDPDPSSLEEIKNFLAFRSRLGLRAPLSVLATIQDDQGTPADVTNILEVLEHSGQVWVVSYSATTDKVYLHSMDSDGSSLTLEAVVWTGVTAKPTVTAVSFTGGTAASPESRLYISDYDQNQTTRYWDGAAMQDLTVDLDANSAAESVKFSMLGVFKFHLWGTGFYEGTALRPEMLRFSQPGTVSGTDPAGGTNPREWWSADHRSVGRRGDPITAMAVAGDRLLVFQRRATHIIYGSGSTTWTRQGLSNVTGCVGPHAVESADENIVYFWADDGPYRTDGTALQYLGLPIKQLIAEVDAGEYDVNVGYSPEHDIVYFVVSPAGEDSYHLALAFDHLNEKWLKTEWLVGTATEAEIGAFGSPASGAVASSAAPGPDGAPSGLTVTATSDTEASLSWTNGDTNLDTKTHVYRSTSTGFTPSDATNHVGTVGSGGAGFEDTGLSPDTTYYYKLRHFRNNQHSTASAEASDQTLLAEPTALTTRGITGGVEISGTNNASGADVVLQRRVGTGGTWTTINTFAAPGATFGPYDDDGHSCGLVHYYRAKATKAGSTDSDWSDEVNRATCHSDDVPSGTPTSVTAIKVGSTQADVSWTDNADDEDEFKIQASTDGIGGPYSPVAAGIVANSTTHRVTGLTPATEYYFKVQACNNAGCGALSNASNSIITDP